jgi:hypothetical protein
VLCDGGVYNWGYEGMIVGGLSTRYVNGGFELLECVLYIVCFVSR